MQEGLTNAKRKQERTGAGTQNIALSCAAICTERSHRDSRINEAPRSNNKRRSKYILIKYVFT